MKIYWTLSSVPELAPLPHKERGTIWRESYEEPFRDRRFWGNLAVGVCAGLGGSLGSVIGGRVGHQFIGAGAGAYVGSHIGAFIHLQFAVRAALPGICFAASEEAEQPANNHSAKQFPQ